MKRTILLRVTIAVLAISATSGAQAQNRKQEKKDAPVTAAQNNAGGAEVSQPSSVPATADPAYVIGPEDVLDIDVWKEPGVSRRGPVRPDGKISLPLLNDAQNVTEQLRKFVTNPQVTVTVTTINSQRVFVVGEVLRAGAFPLIPGMTVLQAISSAGGLTTFANVKKIRAMWQVNGKRVGRSDPVPPLPAWAGDTLRRRPRQRAGLILRTNLDRTTPRKSRPTRIPWQEPNSSA